MSRRKSNYEVGPDLRFFTADGVRNGEVDFDLDPHDVQSHSEDEVAKRERNDARESMTEIPVWGTAVEYAGGDLLKAKRLFRAWLDGFETGIRRQYQAMKKSAKKEW